MRFLNGCIYKAMLFYKMENELNQLEKELLCQSPKEILKSAYELTFKRELLLLFGESSTDFLTEDIIRQLYGLEYPLQALYLAWLKEDSSELEMLRSFVVAYCQDSFKASQNRQAEEQTAIDEERYELIEVYGQRALFSEGHISDSDIPDGMYHYDLREGDGFRTYFASIEPNVRVDFSIYILKCLITFFSIQFIKYWTIIFISSSIIRINRINERVSGFINTFFK